MTAKVAFIEPPYFINYGIHNEHRMRINAPDKFSKPTSIEKGEDLLFVDFALSWVYFLSLMCSPFRSATRYCSSL